MKFFTELPDLTEFFCREPPINLSLIADNKQLKKVEKGRLKELLELSKIKFDSSNFNAKDLQEKLNQLLDETNEKPAVLFSLIRIATTWAVASPALAESLAVLGKETVLKRIEQAIDVI